MKTAQFAKRLQKGFTLIELIVVIAILGVLSVVLITTIDPIDKINAANDSGAISTVAQLGKANDSYASTHNNFYVPGGASNNFTGAVTDLKTAGETKFLTINPPSNSYVYTYLPTTATCTVAGNNCTGYVLWVKLLSKKYTSGNTTAQSSYYVYTNGQGCTKLAQASAPVLTATCP